MGLVYIAEPPVGTSGIDGRDPVARFELDGVYCFLQDDFQELKDATGQWIHPHADAYFGGDDLSELERFLAGIFERVVCQSAEWDQPVGTTQAGELSYQRTSRNEVVAFLRKLAAAARMARENDLGVLIRGE
jgi:hypothetical protein